MEQGGDKQREEREKIGEEEKVLTLTLCLTGETGNYGQ